MNQAIDAVDELIENGWKWIISDIIDLLTGYAKGWWVKPDADDVRKMRRGDPKDMHQSALDTIKLYQL